MALPAGFLDELRARTPLPALIGRRVRLVRSGRHSKGCCPFHGEKSPSFYVYEDHFHCFGCGAHGDAISFVMQSQGASFPDAVASLAAEAGLSVPAASPSQAQAERRRLDLHGVLEAAHGHFRTLLARSPARDYLAGRGILPETVSAWGLGWSGPGRGELRAALAGEDISEAMMAEAGLMRLGEDGMPAGELFFNRLTFPIRDGRGRIVAFGGRVLGDGQPKYLNGPETELFSKRRHLFGLDQAAAAVRHGQRIVVVEGYMDVIALHQAGFAGAVAPLGTALTAEQFALLWRLSPMPILCFDGDAAGGRAAARAAELALPLLAADRSLLVARLPTGEDPDSLVRRQGTGAFAAVLDAAVPLADALYDLLREPHAAAGPEARAALRQSLEAAAARIGDRALAREIRSALLDRFFAASRARGTAAGRKPLPVARARPDEQATRASRWAILLGLVLRHPFLLGDVHEALALLAPPAAADARLHAALLDCPAPAHRPDDPAEALDTEAVMNHLRHLGLAASAAQALQSVARLLPASAAEDASPAEVEATWWHFYGLMDPTRLDDEISRARAAFEARADSASLERLTRLAEARAALRRGEIRLDDDT